MKSVKITPNGETSMVDESTCVHVETVFDNQDGSQSARVNIKDNVSESVVPQSATFMREADSHEIPVEDVSTLFENAHENGQNVSMVAQVAEQHADKI